VSVAPKKVLVAEGDEIVVVLISHLLTRQSYLVHTTLNALEADQMIQREPYDVLLIDVGMLHGGFELLERVSGREPDLLQRIIAMTVSSHDSDRVGAMPVHAVVKKPFVLDQLVDTVRSCVEKTGTSNRAR